MGNVIDKIKIKGVDYSIEDATAREGVNTLNADESTDGSIAKMLKGYVKVEPNKGLSTNDYDDTAVAEVDKIKDKVDVEVGKSLVSDTDIAQITTNKDAIEVLNSDENTEGSVAKQIKDAVGNITEFDTKVVASLPTTGEKGIIYFVPKADSSDPDIHDEYVWVGDKFELIGNSKIDLTNVVKTENIVTVFETVLSDEKLPSEKLVKESLDEKIGVQQKVEDKGKALVVGEDGKIILSEIETSNLECIEFEDDLYADRKGEFIKALKKVLGADKEQVCFIRMFSSGEMFMDIPSSWYTGYAVLNMNTIYVQLQDADYFDNSVNYVAYIPLDATTFTFKKKSQNNEAVEKAIADNWGGSGYNLIPFPYYRKSGYSFKDCTYTYTDEWITAVKQAGSVETDDSYFSFSPVDDTLEEGKYALILDGDIDDSIHFRLGVDRRKADPSMTYLGRYVTGDPKSKVALFEYNDKADGVAPQCWICFTHGASAVTATFRAMLVKVNEDGTYSTEYERHAKGNVALTDMFTDTKAKLDDEIARRELEIAELKVLGWTVPKGLGVQNEVNGNTFIQRVGRITLFNKTWNADGIGVGGVNVFRFEMPTNCKTYNNNTKWNIYVDGYTTRPLVSDHVGDVTANDKSVGGRSAGGNYIEFSTKTYSKAEDFLTYMNENNLYLYYEITTPITRQIDGNENPNMVGSKLERFVAPATDAEILALPNGIYSINVNDVGTSLFPNTWGTLVVLKSGYVYGTMLYIGANAKMYFRNIVNGAWRESSWTTLN